MATQPTIAQMKQALANPTPAVNLQMANEAAEKAGQHNNPHTRSLQQGWEHGWYHGSTGDIKSFRPDLLGESTGAASAKKGYFFARDPSTPPAHMVEHDPQSVEMLTKLGKPIPANPTMAGHGAQTAGSYAGTGGSREYKEAMRKAKAAEKSGKWDDYEKYMAEAEDSVSNEMQYRQGLVAKHGDARDEMLEKINNAWYGAQNADKFKKMSQGEYEAHDKLHKKLMPYGWYTSPLYDDKMYQNLIGHISSATGHKHSKEAIDAIKKYRSVHNERKAADVESGANILPVALRYKNPMYHDFQGKSYRDQTYSDLMDEAKRKGHDALILKNTYDPGGSGGVDKMVDVGVVFHPHQIRSKFAAFHPDRGNESDLLAARGGSIHMAGGGQPNLDAMRLMLLNNEPLDIVGNTKRNLQGAWNVAKSVPGNLQRMVTDPVAYAKSLPAPTGEQIMNMFQPGHVGAMAGVIKPKGGNWYKSPRNNVSVEGSIDRLRPYQSQVGILPNVKAEYEKSLAQAESDPSGRLVRHHKEMFDEATQRHALNQWVENNLQNYVKKQMGTPEDPIRALHEEGITHLPKEVQTGLEQADRDTRIRRVEAGYPEHGVAKSDLGKMWENLADEQIWSRNAGDIQAAPAMVQKLEQAEKAMRDRQNMVTLKFRNLINKNESLNDAEKRLMLVDTPMHLQAKMVGDTELQGLIGATLKAKEPFMRENEDINKVNPWISGMPPETKLYQGHASGMGFDHVIDILKQDVESGRIRPEQLNKISVSDAVRRTHEFDQEMAKKMAEAQIKATEGMPVHKEYPEGYKWIELTKPEVGTELPPTHQIESYTSKTLGPMHRVVNTETGMKGEGFATPERALKEFQKSHAEEKLADALRYEGDTMGHCVGGYCPDVLEGKSRIFSLRSANGEPHVTVEVEPNPQPYPVSGEAFAMLPQATKAQYGQHVREWRQRNPHIENLTDEHTAQALREAGVPPQPDRIVQIKGKQNAAPVAEYQPYVQDFVKSGKWSDVGDLQNTGLQKWNDKYLNKQDIESLSPAESDAFSSRNLNNPAGYKRGGIIYKAEGGNVQPNIAQMRMALQQRNPIEAQNIGVNEAPNMLPKIYFSPSQNENDDPTVGNSFNQDGMPIGGVDQDQQQPGQQLMAPQQPGQPPQGAQPPQGGLTPQGGLQSGPQGPTPPMGNMLSMTPQGQAMQAMGGAPQGGPPGAPTQPAPTGMADGGGVHGYANGDGVTRRDQTVSNPQRMAYSGIYKRPDVIASEAAARVAPEDPILKQLFGVTRADMYAQANNRLGAPHLGKLPGAAADPQGTDPATNVMTKRNEQRLLDVLDEAKNHESLVHGMEPWYYMDPLFQHMVRLLGMEKAIQEFKKMNALGGMASSSSEVNAEIPRGSLAYYLQNQGRFNEFVEHGGKRDPNRPADFGETPGHIAHKTAHALPMQKFLTRGEVDMGSPKVPMYIEASGVPETGFQTTMPVGDAHWSRAVGLADTRNKKMLKGKEVIPGQSGSNAEMAVLGPWWQHKIAHKMGLQSVPAQALAWGAFSPQTGVTTPIGAPKLELIAQQIRHTAKRLGVSPETARDLVLTGKERMGKKKGGDVKLAPTQDTMRLALTKKKAK